MPETLATYEGLCKTATINPAASLPALTTFSQGDHLAESQPSQRLAGALKVLLSLCEDQTQPLSCDRIFFDTLMAQIDERLNQQLDSLLHHPDFQALAACWSGLHYLVERTQTAAAVKIHLIDVDKESLLNDFEASHDATESGLYEQVYTQEYDTPGGEPFSAMIADYSFSHEELDLELMKQISKVAAAAHCPFIAAADPAFFLKKHAAEVPTILDLHSHMDRAEYIQWNSFRKTEDARYIGLTFPRFLLRLPYGKNTSARHFQYKETVLYAKDYLWGNACFAFAANLVRSFQDTGWAVQIRGPRSGGKVEDLPLPTFDFGAGSQVKPPVEISISETQELTFAQLGFLPLCYYRRSNFACFFSANSIQQAPHYLDDLATWRALTYSYHS